MASIGSLVADLRLESAAFRRDLTKATRDVASNTAAMRKSMRAVETASRGVSKQLGQIKTAAGALAGALAVRQFTSFTKSALDSASAIQDVADKVGLTTTQLQQMRFAATQSGVQVSGLDVAMQRFSRRVGEAASGAGTLKDVLKENGIAIRNANGTMRSQVDILGDYAEAIRSAGSEQEQLLLTFKAFDTEGAALVNLFREGREGLKQYMDQALAFGAVMSKEVIARAKIAGDNLAALNDIFKTSFNTSIINAFADSLTLSADDMMTARQAGEAFGTAVGKAMLAVSEAAKFVSRNMKEITAAVAALVAYKATTMFAGIALAVGRLAVALKGAAATQGLLNTAMRANPIGLIATAVSGLVGAYILLKDETFKIGDATIHVGTLLSTVWTAVTLPVRSMIQEVLNFSRIVKHVFKGEFVEALKAGKNIGQNFAANFDDVIAKFKNIVPDSKLAAEAARKLEEALNNAGGGFGDINQKVAESIQALKREADQTEQLIAALGRGEAAYAAISAEIEIANQAHDLGVDFATAQGKAWLSAAQQAKVLTDRLEALTKAQKETEAIKESVKALTASAEQTRRLVAALKQGEDAYERVSTEIAIANDAQKLNVDLTTEQGREWLAAAREAARMTAELQDLKDAQTEAARAAEKHADEQKRLREEQRQLVLEPFKNAIEGIQRSFTDMFASIFSGGVNSFKDLGREVKQIFIRLAAEIAALLVFRPVVASVLGAVGLSGVSSSLGLLSGGGAGGGSAASTAGSLLGILSGGSGGGFGISGLGGVSLVSSLVGGLQSPLGASIGIGIADKLGLGAFGQSAFAGAGLNAPFSLLGSGLNSLLGIKNGIASTAGGLIGGGIGSTIGALGAFGGPVGAVAGTVLGGLLGGLFGGKPSRAVEHAAVRSDGGVAGLFGLVKNPAQGGQQIEAIATEISKVVNAELQKQGKILSGFQGLDIRQVLNAGAVGDKRFQAFSSNFIPGIKGGNNALNFEADDVNQFVSGVAALILKNAATKADPAIAKAQADAQKQQAAALAEITAARKAETAAIEAQLRAQVRANLNVAAGGIVDFLREQSLSPDSTLSPSKRLTEAQRQFGGLLKRVRAGEVGLTGSLTQSAGTLLGIGRENFASTVDFANLERFVRSSLLNVAEQISSEKFFDQQVEATRQQTGVLGEKLDSLEGALRAIRSEIRILREQQAA